MCASAEPKSIREFMKLILQTEIPEAKIWVVKYVTPFRGWDSYAKMAATEESVGCIAEGISAQISMHIRQVFGSGKPYAELSDHGHKFLQEIYQKATALGLVLDPKTIDFILEPRMPPMA